MLIPSRKETNGALSLESYSLVMVVSGFTKKFKPLNLILSEFYLL